MLLVPSGSNVRNSDIYENTLFQFCGRRFREVKAARHDGFSPRSRLHFGIIQKISPALIGKTFQTDAAAARSTESFTLRFRREALLKVFKGIELARFGFHVG